MIYHADPVRAFGIQRTYITFEIRVSHNVDIIFRHANISTSNIKLAHGKRRFAATILTFRSALLSGATKKFYRIATCLLCSQTVRPFYFHRIFLAARDRAPMRSHSVPGIIAHARPSFISVRTGCYRARHERTRFKKRQQEERNTIGDGP